MCLYKTSCRVDQFCSTCDTVAVARCAKLELQILKVGRFSIGWFMLAASLVRAHLDFCTSRGQTQWFLLFLPRCMECRRGLAMRIPSVRPSVRLSVRQTRELWQNGRKICLHFYTIRKIIYPTFLLRKRNLVGATPSTWNFGSTGPRWSEIADFEPIIARIAPQPYDLA